MFCQSGCQIHSGSLAVWVFYIQSGYQRNHHGNDLISTHHLWTNKGVWQCESIQTFYKRFQIRTNTFGITQISHPVLVSYICGTRTKSSTSMILPSPTDYPVAMVPLICSYFLLCRKPFDTWEAMNNARESRNDLFCCGWALASLSCMLFCIYFADYNISKPVNPYHNRFTFGTWNCFSVLSHSLTYWGRGKMTAISQKIFSNALSWMNVHEFR